MNRNILVALVIGASLFVQACATVKGMGRDIESVGDAGSNAIDDAK